MVRSSDEESDGAPEEIIARPGRQRAATAAAAAAPKATARPQQVRQRSAGVRHGEADEEEDEDDDDDTGASSGSDDGDESDDPHDHHRHRDTERSLEAALADVPLETLARLRADGLGPTGAAARAAAAAARSASARLAPRASKNAPTEMSSKRQVGRFRDVLQAPKQKSVDPRFDAPNGRAAAAKQQQAPDSALAAARRRYAFIYDEVLPAERAELKAAARKSKGSSPAARAELQAQAARLDAALRDEAARRRRDAVDASLRAEQRARVAAGAAPFYPKKSEKRALEARAKFEELKATGQLDKYMEKRRKRNAAKDHRYLPSGRRGGGGGGGGGGGDE